MSRIALALGGTITAGGVAYLAYKHFSDSTTDNDATGEAAPPITVSTGARSLGARAVEVLSRYIGAKGEGTKGTSGYHRGTVIDMINLGVYGDGKRLLGKPWCARAIRYAYEKAAQELGLPPPFAAVKSTLAAVRSWKEAPFTNFVLTSPRVGAALLIGDKQQHATLIAKVLDAKTVVTVEGNHGDAVANVKHTIKPGNTIVDVASFAGADNRPRVAGLNWLDGLDFLGVA